tara:strand:+ start:3452 stop:4126 length:675 start_codon:yes stop_codon:yes gene_type:complete
MDPRLHIEEFLLNRKKGFRAYLNGTPLSRKPISVELAVKQAQAIGKGGNAKRIKAYALGEDDVKKIIPTLKVVSYPDLLKANSIDEVLDHKGRLLLLYLTIDRSTGHWVCLLKRRGTKTIEYFDPYGNFRPDGEGKWNSAEKQREFGQDTHHLTKLLNASPYKVLSNAFPFQSKKMDNNTCGRHCVTRLYFKHLDLPAYRKMVEGSGVSPDDFVSGFTYNLIGK